MLRSLLLRPSEALSKKDQMLSQSVPALSASMGELLGRKSYRVKVGKYLGVEGFVDGAQTGLMAQQLPDGDVLLRRGHRARRKVAADAVRLTVGAAPQPLLGSLAGV